MSPTPSEIPLKLHAASVLYGKHIAVVGRLGGMNRKDFGILVESKGGNLVELSSPSLDLIVIGEEATGSTSPTFTDVERMTETALWESLGFIEPAAEIGRLYTPAMLAEILDVPVSTIRRWHRRSLIQPKRQVKKLPYFDFEEVASARRIARLIASGKSPAAIESKLSDIALSGIASNRSLSQLSVIVEGQDVLLKQGDGLIEPCGQQVLPFESHDDKTDEPPEIISMESRIDEGASFCNDEAEHPEFLLGDAGDEESLSPDSLIELAIDLEDDGDLHAAIDCYRTILMSQGPSADIVFRIAELLYQVGDLNAARERYYNAIELEPSFIEARASLGCVLMELGETEKAVSSFQGALDQHRNYPDVHFHLAKLLTETGRRDEAIEHWRAFLDLAPKSPWAEEAKSQLGEILS